MKQTTAFILFGSLALGSIAAGIAGSIHYKRKERNHRPAATFRDLYEDNLATASSILLEGGDDNVHQI